LAATRKPDAPNQRRAREVGGGVDEAFAAQSAGGAADGPMTSGGDW
jgi:hypothetical protein